MTISFDLDDTLIPGVKRFPTESRTLWRRLSRAEPLRRGTAVLWRALQEQGHHIVIYTTSLRSRRKIWWTFFVHGILLRQIINQKTHGRRLGKDSSLYSKYPPAFSIDVHIDDSEGVAMEGQRHGFAVIVIEEREKDWQGYILDALKALPQKD
ncbi:HAD family hydrolase [Taibaiella koreensis]|uniref:HAD family hydrolase n=1 Tax=Taibaiella koreensis TaxID=1268548 RepID=UPI000E59A4A8|nr:HAD family hydrolase [Taibaiella koreensis]